MLSDPGRLLVNECLSKNITVTPIPGVSSVTAAMSISGFKDQFLFYGFLPKTLNDLEKILEQLSEIKYSQVFFMPSNKLNFYLKNFKRYFAGREILIAKEITKLHEAFIRGKIDELKTINNSIKGELTVVISERKSSKTFFDEKKIVNKKKKIFKKL